MRVRTMILVAALACWSVSALAQAQGPAATQTGPTPMQVVDSPATHIGATVKWVVRFKTVVAEVGSDGRVVTDRILYEWRDAAGKWTNSTVVVPAANLHFSDAAALRNEQMLQAAPRLLVVKVKGVEGIPTSTGRTIAVALDSVTLDVMPAARPGAIGPGVGS